MIGQTISHYKIIDKLGSGGVGVVYKALDLSLNRHVAIKFLPLSYSSNETDKKRFIQEAQTASSLDHPNIVTIHEIDETPEGQLFIVMGYYEGETLAKKIAEGSLSLENAMYIFGQLLNGVMHAHTRGIIHRDLKPSNVIITAENRIKILDFGLARFFDSDHLTQSGSTQGTVAYMSPEQAQGLETDYRTDVWSLGVLFYQMLTGVLPFTGKFYQALVYSIVNLDPKPLSETGSEQVLKFQSLVNKALEKDIGNRYQSVAEMAQDFETLVPDWSKGSDSTGMLVTPKLVGKKGLGKKSSVIVVSALFVIALLISQIFHKPAPAPDSTGRYTIAVADVVNTSDMGSLNSISGYLITSLEQFKKLHVLTREQMQDFAYTQFRQRVQKFDELTLRRLCREAEIEILVIPTIRYFEGRVTIEIRLLDPARNKTFVSNIERGLGMRSIPDLMDSHAEFIRNWLAKNEAQIESSRERLADITTDNIQAYDHFTTGEAALNSGDLSTARKEFETAIEHDSTFGMAYYRLSQAIGWASGEEQPERRLLEKAIQLIDNIPEKYRFLVLARKSWVETGPAEALKTLKTMESQFPREKEMLYALASANFSVKDFDSAIHYCKRVLEQDPANLSAFQLLMKIYLNRRELSKALNTAERFMSYNEKIGAFEAGKIYEHLRIFPAAVEKYKKVLSQYPRDTEALSHLMSSYRKMKKYDDMKKVAVDLMHAADNDYFFREAGYAMALAGDFELALNTLNDIITLFPERADYAKLEMATMYDYTERYKQAEALLRSIIASHPRDQIGRLAYDRLFRTLIYQGKFQEALRVADQQKSYFTNMPKFLSEVDLRRSLVWLWGMQNADSAWTIVRQSLKTHGPVSSPDFWINLVSYYEHANKPDSVLKLVNTVYSNQGAHNELSIYYSITDECEKASAIVDTLANKTAAWERVRALYHLCCCLDKNNMPDEALVYLKKLQNTYSHFVAFRAFYYPRSYLLVARQYDKLQNWDEAVKNYQKFLDLWHNADDNLPDLLEARRRLKELKT